MIQMSLSSAQSIAAQESVGEVNLCTLQSGQNFFNPKDKILPFYIRLVFLQVSC